MSMLRRMLRSYVILALIASYAITSHCAAQACLPDGEICQDAFNCPPICCSGRQMIFLGTSLTCPIPGIDTASSNSASVPLNSMTTTPTTTASSPLISSTESPSSAPSPSSSSSSSSSSTMGTTTQNITGSQGSPTSQATSTTTTESSSAGLTAGAIVGIAMGSIICVGGIALFVMHRRSSKDDDDDDEPKTPKDPEFHIHRTPGPSSRPKSARASERDFESGLIVSTQSINESTKSDDATTSSSPKVVRNSSPKLATQDADLKISIEGLTPLTRGSAVEIAFLSSNSIEQQEPDLPPLLEGSSITVRRSPRRTKESVIEVAL